MGASVFLLFRINIMLKVFEAFAGYGSQRMALRNLGIPHEVVGISEIVEDAILAYAAIHTDLLSDSDGWPPQLSDSEMVGYLESVNVPLDYKTFENRARLLKKDALRLLYRANRLAKNFGDIKRIVPETLPDFDLFTYSFPCQDISVAGYQRGLDSDSGTRSSLLWECCKIIETKRPRYLMMENVKNLLGTNHRRNFSEFLRYLEKLGYTNCWNILNARDFGVPQNRERVFCISSLDADFAFKFPNPVILRKSMSDMLEPSAPERLYLKNGTLESPITQKVCYCIDSNYWKGSTLENFLTKRRRQLVTDGSRAGNGSFRVRRLTTKEAWRLMGCSDSDFEKAAAVVSSTGLYKLAGNSIVVAVLEAVFRSLFLGGTAEDFSEIKRRHQLTLF